MPLPERIAEPVRRALEEHRLGRAVAKVTPVGGGCINHGARIDTDTGASVFLKWNDAAPAGMFDAEADGLRSLAAAEAVRVPSPIAWSDAEAGGADGSPGETSWLLMEHVPAGSPTAATEERLGAGLAALHASSRSSDRGPARGAGAAGEARTFGWHRDNWIGSLAQANTGCKRWGTFWSERRLAPQLERARRAGHVPEAVFDRVLDLCPGALAEVNVPELLHGDLWGGNWFAAADGEPVLIDPAVYRGHGEVDLAMSELFGGFGARFYAAYRDARGIGPAYDEYRRDLYQLYYLLVHVNLFGASYVAGSLGAARRVVAAHSG